MLQQVDFEPQKLSIGTLISILDAIGRAGRIDKGT